MASKAAARSVNKDLQSEAVRSQLQTDRAIAGTAQKTARQVRDTHKAVERYIPNVPHRAVAELEEAYTAMASGMLEAGRQIVGLEVRAMQTMFALHVAENVLRVPPALVASALTAQVVMGRPAMSYWSDQSARVTKRFMNIVRPGVILGRTKQEMIADWRKVTNIEAAAAAAQVQTSIHSMLNDARMKVYVENADLLKGVQAVATLDDRTTALCRSRDGMAWGFDGKPLVPQGVVLAASQPPAEPENTDWLGKGWERIPKGKPVPKPAPDRASFWGEQRYAWTVTHENSQWITAVAAKKMGIRGYPLPSKKSRAPIDISKGDEWHHYRNTGTPRLIDKTADAILRTIYNDTAGAEEVLFHGFENARGIKFSPGDTFRLPPTAVSGSARISLSYAIEHMGRLRHPTMFVFPEGTRIIGIGAIEAQNVRELGYLWSEAITAGHFRVRSVHFERETRRTHILKGTRVTHPMVQVVEVEPIGYYRPGKGWVDE